jgi:hypothetical protein
MLKCQVPQLVPVLVSTLMLGLSVHAFSGKRHVGNIDR